MTEAMPFLQKAILLSYDPRPFAGAVLFLCLSCAAGAVDLVPGAGGYSHRHGAGVSAENSHKNKKALFITNFIQ